MSKIKLAIDVNSCIMSIDRQRMKTSEIIRNEALKHQKIAAKLNSMADELEFIENERVQNGVGEPTSAGDFSATSLTVTPCNSNDLIGVSQTEACRRVLETIGRAASKEEIFDAIVARGGSIKGPTHLGPVLSRNKELFIRVGKDQWHLVTAARDAV